MAARGPPRAAADFTVVGIGASAGGLEACRKLLAALPYGNGLAFILVQHLDPNHDSMMAELLAGDTAMSVCQATDGCLIETDHLYLIPPGAYLSVGKGALHLSEPPERHGARLPFDFLLHSMAEDLGPRAVAVILSGTGADGSLGIKSIREASGLIIAQDPAEAGFEGMPRCAIRTGVVDLVVPASEIAAALVAYDRRLADAGEGPGPDDAETPQSWLPKIIELLKSRTSHDFTLYKPGTLRRRIERRMALAVIGSKDAGKYIDALEHDPVELGLLAKDLLINVTSFFRDTKVFDHLAESIVPALLKGRGPDQPLRIWIAGCSTGEEAYSLVMLFREHMFKTGSNAKLQVFASDVDTDAVAVARDGLYPVTIAADVGPTRLARFFTKEEHGYRVSPELRNAVVFTVQDVIADPPFSRLDMISCRNMLIYLGSEAQAMVIRQFHFALRENGILLLGTSEAAGDRQSGFEEMSKPERLYRNTGRGNSGQTAFAHKAAETASVVPRRGADQAGLRPSSYADACRRLLLDAFAPAAILINSSHECLDALGPVDRFLRIASGYPTKDLFAMAPHALRAKLRWAIDEAIRTKARSEVPGGRIDVRGKETTFSLQVLPVPSEGGELLLVCFVESLEKPRNSPVAVADGDATRAAELERELEALRAELQGAVRNLEISSEEQKSINEEALSVNEEYQSTNEELLTSNEELQSLNEELTALNGQLQETLDRQRTTSDDLQNILYSTDVATLFLDTSLNIRFFTPATRLLFNVIPSDVGRPLADLSSLAADGALLGDARSVLEASVPIEREIEAQNGIWFNRRILPCRTHDDAIEGVVITFNDITERKRILKDLEAAKHQAELATIAKSRFLAVASHDLRQPLQTLALLQGLLAKRVADESATKLVSRMDDTLAAMAEMLNSLLDINRIESGTVRPEPVDFRIDDLLEPLKEEFLYPARAQGLDFRTVPCGLTVRSDRRMLEQMIRNLLSNALKYTERGKVLLGCRRRGDCLSIEIWDTGIGTPPGEIEAIFTEYHQVDNPARKKLRGLGLGLSIVQRLGRLLDHDVRVRSEPGKGSVFSIDIKRLAGTFAAEEVPAVAIAPGGESSLGRTGTVLVVEDDRDVRELIELALQEEGYHLMIAPDGPSALTLVTPGSFRPDLVLADYDLPLDIDGLQLAAKLREVLGGDLPVIILTGNISSESLSAIADSNCLRLSKPVKLDELTSTVRRMLPLTRPEAAPRNKADLADGDTSEAVIFVVDDDPGIREAIRSVLEAEGRTVADFPSCEAFLDAYRPGSDACLLVDAYLPGMSGLALLQHLHGSGNRLPAIMITGNSDVDIAVKAMKAGASDFIEKPIRACELIESIGRALDQQRDATKISSWREGANLQMSGLTTRQRQIMEMVLAGHPSKNIAADLGISQRTVENHRAAIMKRTGSKSLPALVRLAMAASSPSVLTDGNGTSGR